MERIRDKGRTAEEAARIQDIVGSLGQMTAQRVIPIPAFDTSSNVGYDSEGIFHG